MPVMNRTPATAELPARTSVWHRVRRTAMKTFSLNRLDGRGYGKTFSAAILAVALGWPYLELNCAMEACFCYANAFRLWSRPVASAPKLVPALRSHIVHVLLGSSSEQMIGAHAQRIVATVKQPHPVWNRPICDFPRNSMSHRVSPSRVCSDANGSVWPFPFFVVGGPQPAVTKARAMRRHITILVDLWPEPFLKSLRFTCFS